MHINDPSFELNPELGKSINLNAFEPLVKISRQAGVKGLFVTSSSSVYGIKEEANVNEEMNLDHLLITQNLKQNVEKYYLNIKVKILILL